MQELQIKLKDAEDIVKTAIADLDSARETLSKKQTANTKALAQKDVDKAQLIKNQAETIVSYLKIELLRAKQEGSSGVAVPRTTAASDRTAPSDRQPMTRRCLSDACSPNIRKYGVSFPRAARGRRLVMYAAVQQSSPQRNSGRLAASRRHRTMFMSVLPARSLIPFCCGV